MSKTEYDISYRIISRQHYPLHAKLKGRKEANQDETPFVNRKQFIRALKNYNSDRVFNPYTDICKFYDRFNANIIRTRNLSKILDIAVNQSIDAIWIGRDLGHRGGRRTGLALTDEAHLDEAGKKWGVTLNQATKGQAFSERTADNIWRFMNAIEENIFMWNVFPYHPFEEGEPLTNRSHTAQERDIGMTLLEHLESILKPERIVAIGNDAYKVSAKLFPHKNVHKIRHPSYGGEKEFSIQLSRLYKVKRSNLD